MPITALTAALLTPIFLLLSVQGLLDRPVGGTATPIDQPAATPQSQRLLRERAHASFAEYVPLALILLGAAESLQASRLWLHGLGTGLLAARLLHLWGAWHRPVALLRACGSLLTLLVILGAAATCLLLAIR